MCLACNPPSNKISLDFEKGEALAELTDTRLKEVSGLAASIANPGYMWAVNDSGNQAEIYLLDHHLEIRMTVALVGASNRDWEDIAVGPGQDSSKIYIYVADIGDNKSVHPYKHLYRLVEPNITDGPDVSISDFSRIDFRLEDGAKDTEAIFIEDSTRDIYVISKREEPVSVYRLKVPLLPNDTITAQKVLSLPFKEIVAADYHSSTGDVLMKNYTTIYYWKNTNALDPFTLLQQNPLEVPYEPEPQGESITWTTDGSGFFTLSEKKKKRASHLYFYSRKEVLPNVSAHAHIF